MGYRKHRIDVLYVLGGSCALFRGVLSKEAAVHGLTIVLSGSSG